MMPAAPPDSTAGADRTAAAPQGNVAVHGAQIIVFVSGQRGWLADALISELLPAKLAG